MSELALPPRLSDLRATPKGVGLARVLRCQINAKGDPMTALALAQSKYPHDTLVVECLRSAVDAGTMSDATWGAPVSPYKILADEFVSTLRPVSIVARLTSRRVPMNIKIPRTTSGSSAGWVGESAPVPVSEQSLDTITVGTAKAAGICVISNELARFGVPAADQVIAADLASAVAAFTDAQFLDPSVATVANVSPASVLYGIVPTVSSGSTATQIASDLELVVDQVLSAGGSLAAPVWITRPQVAIKLAAKRSTTGSPAFPNISVDGGELLGIPVLVSASTPGSTSGGHSVVLIDQNEILIAEGGVEVSISTEAALQMQSAPSAGAQALFSLWANNCTGVKVVREINWTHRRSAAMCCGYLDALSV